MRGQSKRALQAKAETCPVSMAKEMPISSIYPARESRSPPGMTDHYDGAEGEFITPVTTFRRQASVFNSEDVAQAVAINGFLPADHASFARVDVSRHFKMTEVKTARFM